MTVNIRVTWETSPAGDDLVFPYPIWGLVEVCVLELWGKGTR